VHTDFTLANDQGIFLTNRATVDNSTGWVELQPTNTVFDGNNYNVIGHIDSSYQLKA
jgi:hypothetical protein